ncbi:MAG TPA: glycoside hydrolase family 97 protein [Acidobacteriota bacterium]|nr:glycoside hydrolase family 97 protein [Acidobacteriota bacterium]
MQFRAPVIMLSTGLFLLAGFVAAGVEESSTTHRLSLRSPDGSIDVLVTVGGALTYAVSMGDWDIVRDSRLGLQFHDGTVLGRDTRLLNALRRSVSSTWENRWGKRRQVRDQYNELRLIVQEAHGGGRVFEVYFRAFNDGVAFRYALPSQSEMQSFVLDREQTEFNFAANHPCYAGQQEKGFQGPQEWEFKPCRLADIKSESIIGLPLLIRTPRAWVALAEADLRDWSGMWVSGAATAPAGSPQGVSLTARLAPRRDGEGLVKGQTPHNSPWRVLIIGQKPGELIESDLILNLSTPCQVADTSWIRPGKMAWDHWWSGDVKMDTATIKEYIQLAADMGWPYQLIDWQWYGQFNKPDSDITKVNPAVDMDEVRRFAREKGVRLWLWLYWTDADRNDAYEKAFALYEQWGMAGVKIDFMDSDNQEMVNWYEKISRAAAEHHLMVNFHGAFKTSGFNRTFPNQITREGILGNEYNRWSTRVTPEHKLTLPFTRFLAGPADFTPGGFLNRQPGQFRIDKDAAEVQGTRCAELALFVAYDSPLACVCDLPEHYRNQPGADFLKIVPTVWDDTKVLDAEVSRHLVVVRRSGKEWFLGAMTDNSAYETSVKLDFLGKGRWKMRLWKDSADSNSNAEHLDIEDRVVSSAEGLVIHLAPAGGCVARFQPE